MKEIRLHGRGGQGVVKAAQLVVQTIVECGGYAHFIPFFGVERKGSPVFGFLRMDDVPIRMKMQVYEPELLLIFDDSLIGLPSTYEGLLTNSLVIINSVKSAEELNIPEQAGAVAIVDATGIAIDCIHKNIPNTAMLGAFAKASNLCDWEVMRQLIQKKFGEENRKAAEQGYEKVVCQTWKGAQKSW